MENSRRIWVFRRGSSSNTAERRRRMVIVENRPPISFEDLPPEIIHSIMLRVGVSFESHTVARFASRTIRRVTDDEVYLRDVDLFLMLTSNIDEVPLRNYRVLCQHRGNTSALFLLGCSEFYYRGNLDNAMSMIRESARRGYELAIYVYAMLRRIMNPDNGLDMEMMFPDRNLIRRMRQRVYDSPNRYWGPIEMPALYRERVMDFDFMMIYRCRCAQIDGSYRLHDERIKGPQMCDICFTSIHVAAFVRYFPSRITQWPGAYHF